jgi:hypothetical protein
MATILGIYGRGSEALFVRPKIAADRELMRFPGKFANGTFCELWRKLAGPVTFFAMHSPAKFSWIWNSRIL